jgi:phosphoadenosine phosphosulfate reductase
MTEVDLLHGILQQSPGPACLTCSFQAEDVVVLHMLRQIDPDVPVLFLDTGYHFPELLRYRDELVKAWRINLVNITSRLSREEHEQRSGKLYLTDQAACCRLRKVEPLLEALENHAVWFTGLRREQSSTRANLRVIDAVSLPSRRALWKVSPLVLWRWNEVQSYIRVNEIPYAQLYEAGYTSIGCAPCTTAPIDPGNPRSGRWAGVKLECGIHTFTARS